MMKILFFYVVLVGFILILPSFLRAYENNSADVEKLIALSNEWMQALERKDKNRLEQIIHQDFFILGMVNNDTPTNREQWLKNGVEDSDWFDFRYDNVNVSVLGDTAVVRSTLDFSARRRSGFIRRVSTTAPLIYVWVKQDDRWQVIRRYPAPWTVRRWLDRGIGFLVGMVSLGILICLWRMLSHRKMKVRG
jgi:ketosteroid isomerase-like protein